MLKLSIENTTFDIPDLNKFKLGDKVICDATVHYDRFEGIVVGIELQRLYGSEILRPSITLLEDGTLTDGFKPCDLRKVDDEPSPETNMQAVGTALADAMSERQRQLDAEGWIPQHDDQYRDNELIRAAICYLLGNAGNWPWSRNWWKPTDRRRDLIKASALIIAEIERFDRAAVAGDPEAGT